MAAVSQRRQVERQHGQSVVEVVPEAPRADRRRKVRVRGADEPDIGGLGARAAQAADGALLDHGEKLGLQGIGQQRDLIEEEHPAVRRLKEAGLGAVGIGEGPPLEAEELGLEQRLGDRRTVDVHEGPTAAGAVAMEQAGDQALAGAGVTLDQDGREPLTLPLPVEQPAQLVPDHLDGSAPPE